MLTRTYTYMCMHIRCIIWDMRLQAFATTCFLKTIFAGVCPSKFYVSN